EVGLERGLIGLSPGPLVVASLSYLRAVEDERAGALGMGRREQDREGSPLGLAHDRRALAPDRVQDSADVVHALLEGGRAGYPVGHPHPALVEEHEAGELTETLAVLPELRKLGMDLEVRVGALHVSEVDRPVAHDAVGDIDVATPREANVVHARENRCQRRPNECGCGSDSHTVSSLATCRASGPSDSSDETRTFRFSPTRS